MKKIITDPNILLLDNFASIGNVVCAPGREWDNHLVKEADILLARSVTKVDANLLDGSRVKFVGTATSGFDHIDRQYLARRGIQFSYCPGSNANSVAEYVLSAIIAVTCPDRSLRGMSAGIIGCGHVGARVAEMLSAVGISTILNDPPLGDHAGDQRYRSLEEALSADIVSLHTPLTTTGEYPTKGLISTAQLELMPTDVILINAARGGVVDEEALLEKIANNPQMKTVIDCWENEPAINHQLLHKVTLATPHIAGYSYDGKVKAAKMLYESLCDFLQLENNWKPVANLHKPVYDLQNLTDENLCLSRAVFSCYDIRTDSLRMKKLLNLELDEAITAFDQLRKNYSVRREFEQTILRSCLFPDMVENIGFSLSETSSGNISI